jgi:hypothetical protein
MVALLALSMSNTAFLTDNTTSSGCGGAGADPCPGPVALSPRPGHTLHWASRSSPCTWSGVTCTNGRETAVTLWDRSISGTLPTEIGLLFSAMTLNLGSNSLHGTVPTEIGRLSSATSLILSGNSLSGTLPTEVGLLSSLSILNLGTNRISGTLPTEIGLMTSMLSLSLNVNSLSGTIPAETGHLSKLSSMRFVGNRLVSAPPTSSASWGALGVTAVATARSQPRRLNVPQRTSGGTFRGASRVKAELEAVREEMNRFMERADKLHRQLEEVQHRPERRESSRPRLLRLAQLSAVRRDAPASGGRAGGPSTSTTFPVLHALT